MVSLERGSLAYCKASNYNTDHRTIAFISDPAFIADLAFIRTLASEPWHLLETQHLIGTQHLSEVL